MMMTMMETVVVRDYCDDICDESGFFQRFGCAMEGGFPPFTEIRWGF